MKVLIENVGCDDTTSTIMDLEQKEFNCNIKKGRIKDGTRRNINEIR